MVIDVKNAKVYIDSSCDILYSSYYIYGLKEIFNNRVYFSSSYFEELNYNNQYLAVVIKDKNQLKKIIIDFADSSSINSDALSWCDTYGKINLKEEDKDLDPRIIPIGPSFGIKIYSFFETFFYGIYNLLLTYNKIKNKRFFLSNYKSQFIRERLSQYKVSNEEKFYVFFMSSLWKKETETNNNRANFILACKNNSRIIFEGGFAPRKNNDIAGYENITTNKRIKVKDYLNKIKSSFVVFNTPAVLDCHGWKLGEYLAMNKFIISTPLSRIMPGNFIENVHYFKVDGSQTQIENQLNILISISDEEKSNLKKNIEIYFENFIHPNAIIKRLIQ